MAYRAVRIEQNPLDYFLRRQDGDPFLRVGDIMLRDNKDPKEIFAQMIRVGTGSKWSHSALVYLAQDPDKGYNNTFLVEARTKGIHMASWRNEVIPFDQFTVGIERLNLDWYVESPYEKAHHDPRNPEDTHGIAYLRHVRGIAVDQINGLYDQKTVYEVTALYAKRAARRHLSAVPQVAEAAGKVADLFKKWDQSDSSTTSTMRFICSGLVQYSFFEALRRRIMNDIDIPEHREAALSNLSNIHRVIFRDDPHGVMPTYIHDVQTGKLNIHDEPPEDVLDLLKTAMPADFNNSPRLQWRYIVLNGVVWRIEQTSEDYESHDEDEQKVLAMLKSEGDSVLL
jgi:hypothetical protein